VPHKPPEVRLTSDDKRLLELLASLISEDSRQQSNAPPGQRPLSNSEARELLDRLNELASSKQFVEGLYFAEHVFDESASDRESTREITCSGAKGTVARESWHQRIGRSSKFGWECVEMVMGR
jgi:hypothetical protein